MKKIFDYLIHGIFFFLYGFVKYIPSPLGDIFRWIVCKVFCKKLGKVRIYEGSTFWYPYRIKIGSNVTVNEYCYLSGYGNLSIGNGVRIGSGTKIITSDHIVDDLDIEIYKQGIRSAGGVIIEDDVYIGTNAIILDGVTIKRHSVIGAGSVVTRDVESNTIVAGNPARVIRKLD